MINYSKFIVKTRSFDNNNEHTYQYPFNEEHCEKAILYIVLVRSVL